MLELDVLEHPHEDDELLQKQVVGPSFDPSATATGAANASAENMVSVLIVMVVTSLVCLSS